MQLSVNPDRDELREYFESENNPPVDGHDNFGDANPDLHGGQWVAYDPEYGTFELIGTFPAVDVIHDYDGPETDQFVYHSEVYFGDVVAEDGSFTDRAQRTADQFNRVHSPVELVVDGRFTWFVAAMLDEHREPHGHRDPEYSGDYDDILDRLGVDPRDE